MTREERESKIREQEEYSKDIQDKYRERFFDTSEFGCWITGGVGGDINKHLDKYERRARR